MAKPTTPRHPRTPGPQEPFHIAERRLRETGYILPGALAGAAGVTVGLWTAMEAGHVSHTRAMYDAAVARFPQLSSYPRPGLDPRVVVPTLHPAVEMEYRRTQEFHSLAKRCNFGGTHKSVVREMLIMALQGVITLKDVDWYFGP